MKKVLIILASVALLGAMVTGLYAASAPGDMTMEWPGGSATKGAVSFSHAAHGAVDCLACHHKAASADDAKKCSEAGCHDNFDAKDKKSDNSLYKAFHDKSGTGCVGCHKAQGGPTKCTECHPKQ